MRSKQNMGLIQVATWMHFFNRRFKVASSRRSTKLILGERRLPYFADEDAELRDAEEHETRDVQVNGYWDQMLLWIVEDHHVEGVAQVDDPSEGRLPESHRQYEEPHYNHGLSYQPRLLLQPVVYHELAHQEDEGGDVQSQKTEVSYSFGFGQIIVFRLFILIWQSRFHQ